jgi:shikimate dehydrogenase
MFERAFAAAGLDWRYLTLEVGPDDLAAAVAGMQAMGFRGGNFTIPHKVAVIEHLDGLSEAAELMGAVNCIHCVDGKFNGENTDGKGFVQSLRDVTDPADKRVVILGAEAQRGPSRLNWASRASPKSRSSIGRPNEDKSWPICSPNV